MEKFPNIANKQENSSKLIEALKNKLNIAILYGSISLTALVAVGCGGKKAEQAEANEGASRFPRAEEVVKNEKERDALLNSALEEISHDRFNFEQDGSLVIELHGAKWRIKEKSVSSLKSYADRKSAEMSSRKDEKYAMRSFQMLKAQLENMIVNDGELLNPDEISMTESQTIRNTNRGQIETKTRTIEPKGSRTDLSRTNQVRTSLDFDSQPNRIKGSKEVNLDDF